MVVICKVIHLFFIILWIGSLIILPQLMLWMKGRDTDGVLRKLYYRLQFPSMLLAILFGVITFILLPKDMKAGWFHMKMTAVVLLVVVDSLIRRALASSFVAWKWRLYQSLAVALLAMALLAVYGVRNKENEWLTKYREQELLYHGE